MKLTLGFSPCPNDTFIFDALVNGKIDTGDLQFEAVLEDVETLNQWALEGRLDITKLSFPALFQSANTYTLLNSGSALGRGVGPLLISKREPAYWTEANISTARIALPGANTTAHLLFGFAYPAAEDKQFMLFSKIEDAVLNETADLGVIIHENRFTYQQRGLFKVADLGAVWETKMNAPIPLGGIAIRKQLGAQTKHTVDALIRNSLELAFAHYPSVSDYVKQHAQEMSEDVMRQHIDLYVNDFSLSLAEQGRKAVEELEKTYREINGY